MEESFINKLARLLDVLNNRQATDDPEDEACDEARFARHEAKVELDHLSIDTAKRLVEVDQVLATLAQAKNLNELAGKREAADAYGTAIFLLSISLAG